MGIKRHRMGQKRIMKNGVSSITRAVALAEEKGTLKKEPREMGDKAQFRPVLLLTSEEEMDSRIHRGGMRHHTSVNFFRGLYKGGRSVILRGGAGRAG